LWTDVWDVCELNGATALLFLCIKWDDFKLLATSWAFEPFAEVTALHGEDLPAMRASRLQRHQTFSKRFVMSAAQIV